MRSDFRAAIVAAIVCVSVGCSSQPIGAELGPESSDRVTRSGGDGGAASKKAGSDGGAAAGTAGVGSGSGGGGATDGGTGATASDGGAASCGAEAKLPACYECCDTQHSQGATVLYDAFDACICQTPGACKAQCATTVCQGKAPATGDACEQCIEQQYQACGQQADQACGANAACAGLLSCYDAAKCAQKPEQ